MNAPDGGFRMPVGRLGRLNADERRGLAERLHATQNHICFICLQPIDLALQYGQLDVDHIQPLAAGGPDDESNFAIVHSTCNRRKQSAHLRVARELMRFDRLRERCVEAHGRGPTLAEMLELSGDVDETLALVVENGRVRYSSSAFGDQRVRDAELVEDPLSDVRSFFALLPLAVLAHDHRINPRSIGPNLRGLLEEFHAGRPQLHVSLAWVHTTGDQAGKVHVFDGQHKAAAQMLLGARHLPVRVFIDVDLEMLLETNTNAGSKLRQVAFDKSVLRNLGSSLYLERVRQYQRDHGLSESDYSFSEEALHKHFRGQSREIKRYVADAVRHAVIRDPDNRLVGYIEFAGKGTEKPLSYSAVDKTFFSQLICQQPLATPIEARADEGLNPRELEREQLSKLMTVVAEELLDDRFDSDIGTYRMEKRATSGELLPPEHLAAVRLCREEVMQAWVALLRQVMELCVITSGQPLDAGKILHQPLPEPTWESVRQCLRSLRELPCWSNPALGATVFGGKPNYEYWRTVFATGSTPQGVPVLAKPVNVINMISADG